VYRALTVATPIERFHVEARISFLFARLDVWLCTLTKPTIHCSNDNDQVAQFNKRKSLPRPATAAR